MRVRNTGIILVFIAFIIIISASTAFCADVAKIGVVSFQKILDNSEAGKAARNELTAEGKTMEADLKQRSDEINELKQMLERDTGIITKEARDEKKWELDRKIDDAKALKKKFDRQIQELQMQLLNGIRQDLVKLIREYGEKEGFLLIVDDATVVYAPQSIEISDKIIELYNEVYRKQGTQKQGPKQ